MGNFFSLLLVFCFHMRVHAGTKLSPLALSETARHFDTLYSFLIIVSAVASLLVIGGFIYFAFKYKRENENQKTAYITHNNLLEFLWSFIPLLFFLLIFVWGCWVYYEMRTFSKDSFEIHVLGQKWYWEFQYKSGRKTTADLYVPVNQPVKLIMTSKDVIHSFFIPALRIKQDVVPGQYTALGFKAEKEGMFQVFCAEYCGDQHSSMLAKLHVLSREDFDQWLSSDPYKGLSVAQIGEKVFSGKCLVCHNTSDVKKIGPGLRGLFRSVREFTDGSKALADENYIRSSLLNPNGQIVKGFQKGMMPTFQGQLSEEEVLGLIEYIKTLK